jgi:hypothetical protein
MSSGHLGTCDEIRRGLEFVRARAFNHFPLKKWMVERTITFNLELNPGAYIRFEPGLQPEHEV